MPSIYAHYRFGCLVLADLPQGIRDRIERHRRLFDAGLQGPDFFFFYKPFTKTPVGNLGHDLHYQTGAAFFTRICLAHPDPTEAETAYLYGLLAHYCLDSVCHPFIHEQTDEGPISHNRLESEFERYLMTLDGIPSPLGYDRTVHMKLTPADFKAAAVWYPDATLSQIREGFGTMKVILKLLTCRSNFHRRLAETILARLGGQQPGLLMKSGPDPACSHLNRAMMSLFEQALPRYPVLRAKLRAHLKHGTPLDTDFDSIFG